MFPSANYHNYTITTLCNVPFATQLVCTLNTFIRFILPKLFWSTFWGCSAGASQCPGLQTPNSKCIVTSLDLSDVVCYKWWANCELISWHVCEALGMTLQCIKAGILECSHHAVKSHIQIFVYTSVLHRWAAYAAEILCVLPLRSPHNSIAASWRQKLTTQYPQPAMMLCL